MSSICSLENMAIQTGLLYSLESSDTQFHLALSFVHNYRFHMFFTHKI